MSSKHAKQPEKRVGILGRVLGTIGIVVLVLGGLALIGWGLIEWKINDLIDRTQSAPSEVSFIQDESELTLPDEAQTLSDIPIQGNTSYVTNFLLLGVDSRETGGNGRSDTNMIVSINSKTKTIKIISLLRDTWVTIPGLDEDGDGVRDYSKLNSAYFNGGFDLLASTIRENFRLEITQYAKVDFDAFRLAVDALGGVDVELTKEEALYIPLEEQPNPDWFADPPTVPSIGSEAGIYHLNGHQALAYCRIRKLYSTSDFARQSNQRVVVSKLIEKAKGSSPTALLSMLEDVLPCVTTNIPRSELREYALGVLEYAGYSIEMDYSLPDIHKSDWSNKTLSGKGEGLWLEDPAQTVLELHKYIYEE